MAVSPTVCPKLLSSLTHGFLIALVNKGASELFQEIESCGGFCSLPLNICSKFSHLEPSELYLFQSIFSIPTLM